MKDEDVIALIRDAPKYQDEVDRIFKENPWFHKAVGQALSSWDAVRMIDNGQLMKDGHFSEADYRRALIVVVKILDAAIWRDEDDEQEA